MNASDLRTPVIYHGEYVSSTGYQVTKAPKDYKGRILKGGYVLVHRLKMEKKLGRLLKQGEVVSFRDGNKKNLKLNNLQLYSSPSEFRKTTYASPVVALTCDFCGDSFFRLARVHRSCMKQKYKHTYCSLHCQHESMVIHGKSRRKKGK